MTVSPLQFAGTVGPTGATGATGPTGPAGEGIPLATHASAIANTVNLPAATTTPVFSTASLAVGTWFVMAAVNVSVNEAATAGVDLELVVGTATATLAGKTAAGSVNANDLVAGSGLDFEGVMFAVVTVTVAGTLSVKAVNNDSINASTAEYQSQGGAAISGATGYTAINVG